VLTSRRWRADGHRSSELVSEEWSSEVSTTAPSTKPSVQTRLLLETMEVVEQKSEECWDQMMKILERLGDKVEAMETGQQRLQRQVEAMEAGQQRLHHQVEAAATSARKAEEERVAELPELFQLKCLSPALEARPHLNENNSSIPRI
jgi:septal ring factor EnvC (AmiA/AmiB activator)